MWILGYIYNIHSIIYLKIGTSTTNHPPTTWRQNNDKTVITRELGKSSINRLSVNLENHFHIPFFLLLMVQNSGDHHLGCIKFVVNNGINSMNTQESFPDWHTPQPKNIPVLSGGYGYQQPWLIWLGVEEPLFKPSSAAIRPEESRPRTNLDGNSKKTQAESLFWTIPICMIGETPLVYIFLCLSSCKFFNVNFRYPLETSQKVAPDIGRSKHWGRKIGVQTTCDQPGGMNRKTLTMPR